MRVSSGCSQAKDHIQAANEAVGQAILGLGKDRPDLAVVFTTVEFAHPLALRTATNLLGEIPVIGCSSLAVISSKGICKHGFVIVLISLGEHSFFNVAAVKEISKVGPLAAGRELGEKLRYGCKEVRRKLSLVFSDGLLANAAEFINGVEERLGRSFPLVGASASDNFAFHETYQYFNKEILHDSSCGILWGGKLNFGLGIKHGWKPLGKERRVTRASGNTVHEIDKQPAARLYEDYLNKGTLDLNKELKRISTFYPLGIYLPGEKEYLLRNITAIKNDGSLVTQGNVAQDSSIRLMIGTKDSCLSATVKSCEEARKGLCGHNPKLVFIFNSASRLSLLGRQAEREVSIIRESFGGESVIAGLYTYGEQAPLKSLNYLGRTYFHNQSVCILAMGEDN